MVEYMQIYAGEDEVGKIINFSFVSELSNEPENKLRKRTEYQDALRALRLEYQLKTEGKAYLELSEWETVKSATRLTRRKDLEKVILANEKLLTEFEISKTSILAQSIQKINRTYLLALRDFLLETNSF